MALESASPPLTTLPERSAWKWWICLLLLMATTLNYMDRQALYQTSVRISRDFKLNNQQYGELERSFNYAFGIGAITIGFLADRGNLRLIYPAIVFGWSIVGFATGFVTSFSILLGCRFLLGLFESGNWPCGILTVKRVLPPAQRSLGNGMFQSGTALGAIVTPLVVLACIALSDPRASERSALQMAGGGASVVLLPTPEYSWQLPFRAIGIVGALWSLLWLATVRSRHIQSPVVAAGSTESVQSYWSLWASRQFWVLAAVVVCINVTWRSFGTWLPKFLQDGRGYSEEAMQYFTSLYYLAADLGSISVGFVTLLLVRRGVRLHRSRMFTFGFCACLTTLSLTAVALPRGDLLLAVILLIGFGSLGLFPTYFALSQDLSTRHQGKLTGTLGLLNAIVIGTLAPLQGRLIDETHSFAFALGLAGATPLVAMALILLFWKAPAEKH